MGHRSGGGVGVGERKEGRASSSLPFSGCSWPLVGGSWLSPSCWKSPYLFKKVPWLGCRGMGRELLLGTTL